MRRISIVVCLLASFTLLNACSGGRPYDGDAGRSAAYEPGLPSFDLEAVATVQDGEPGVEVYVSFPRASLVFAATDTGYVARYDLTMQIRGDDGRGTASFTSFGDTLVVASTEAARTFERVRHDERFILPPGDYVVETTLEDLSTGEQAVRRQRVEVRDRTGPPWLSRPLIVAPSSDSSVEPVVSLHVPERRDSLRVQIGAYGSVGGASLDIAVSALRADTTVATPPFWITPSRGSLLYRGIDEGVTDTLFASRVPLAEQSEETVTVRLPPLATGIYRVDARLRSATGQLLDQQGRLLSVKGTAFPQLATLAELVAALDYIAYPREMAFITDGETPDERRRRFDAFWGALVSDRRVASNLLRLYFERVEEANLLFTSHKLGWKTDRGMVYIVFGAPGFVERTFEGEVWHYGYGEEAASTFVFERADYYGAQRALQHFVLVRQPVYERTWARALDRWRRGAAL